MASSSANDIVQAVLNQNQPIRVQGANDSLGAFLVSELFAQNQKPVLVVAPNEDKAQQITEDIEVFLSTIQNSPTTDVLHFPSWKHSPYSSIVPSLSEKFQRIRVLSSLLNPHSKSIIVSTIAGATQRTIPKKTLEDLHFTLELNQDIESFEKVHETLSRLGYRKIDPVEDPGTYTFRGDILDIFPPKNLNPYRIEFFGETVESIRLFDPSTQRTISTNEKKIDSLTINTASEIFFSSHNLTYLKTALKTYCDDNGISKKVRDEIFETIELGAEPDFSSTWAKFLYEEKNSLFDYLPSDNEEYRRIIFDDLSCQQELDTTIKSLTNDFEQLDRTKNVLGKPDELFLDPFNKYTELQQTCSLFVDQLDLNVDLEMNDIEEETDNASKLKHKIFIKTNQKISENPFDQIQEFNKDYRVALFANTQSQIDRISHFLEKRDIPFKVGGEFQDEVVQLYQGVPSQGFRWPAQNIAIITDDEIFGKKSSINRKKKSSTNASVFQSLSDLSEGDYIVHKLHGIGVYKGMSVITLQGNKSEYLHIQYANQDKLFLPVYKLDQIQKYLGTGKNVAIDRLGSQRFEKAKGKVREHLKQLAFNLTELYAQRKMQVGVKFQPSTSEFEEMESQFPFDETEDQLKAINDSITDVTTGKVMDRLICGDVGFGKTEVAMRAAYLAVLSGKQVAVLVPTTVLAIQHDQTFRARLSKLGVKMESLSRLKKPKEQKEILSQLSEGKVDVIIGTHRLLSKQVKFKDLGLIIVDEEHRFGVEHKEKLKTLKLNTHVMTLTATPIPRTLHMAMSGLRDISLIATPPVDRLPIRTFVSKYDEEVIKKAVQFELSRNGQVFFLHNRVESIYEMSDKIKQIVPEAKITVAHGQLSEAQLEKAMLEFYQKKSNVLVCTTIIESGLDIPAANTIVINRADMLGLAQLYQLRGRVGRSNQRAYAYLLVSNTGALTDDAKKRLDVIQRFVELGSGFQIASHDLEIRGGGNLLGAEQSGQIAAVGFDLYTELLQEAIEDIKSGNKTERQHLKEPEIKTPFGCYLNEEYIPGIQQRLSFYRRLSNSEDLIELEQIEEEIQDRYGKPTDVAENLFWMIRLKIMMRSLRIETLTASKDRVSIAGGEGSKLDPQKVIQLAMKDPSRIKLLPDARIVFFNESKSMKDLVLHAEENLKKIQA